MSRIQIQERWEWEEQDYDTFLEELGEEQVMMMVLMWLLIEKVFLLSPTLQPGIVWISRNCYPPLEQYYLTFQKGFSSAQNQELHHILDLNCWRHIVSACKHLLVPELHSIPWLKYLQDFLCLHLNLEVLPPLPCTVLDPVSSASKSE